MRARLERLAAEYNRASRRGSDPVRFIYDYDSPGDRELAGFIVSTLAYGRVEQIIKSCAKVLAPLGPGLRKAVRTAKTGLTRLYGNFRHRLNKGSDIALLLLGLRDILSRYGSLLGLFRSSLLRSRGCLRQTLSFFVGTIRKAVVRASIRRRIPLGYVMHLLPSPESNSACKRMNLFLKWMIRKDAVDPGVWSASLPGLRSRLVIPLDVHISRNARRHGMTDRKTDDWKTAEEITAFLRVYCPEDPLKYDFAICHEGMDSVRLHGART